MVPDGPDAGDAGPEPETGPRRALDAADGQVYPGWYSHDVGGELADFTSLVGRTPPVVFTFHDWNAAGTGSGRLELQTFDAPFEGETTMTVLDGARAIASEGSILAIAWDPIGYVAEEPAYWSGELQLATSFQALIDGEYDSYIRECARQIKALGVPIMLSPFAEMDSTAWFMFGPEELTALDQVDDTRGYYGDPDVPDGPERLRDGFRHVVDIFREEAVNNVTWFLYSATGYMGRGDKSDEEWARIDEMHPRYFYPGDDYVDWIGTSIYVENGGGTLSEQLDTGMSAWREVTDRPFFSPEFGLLAAGGDRTALIETIIDQVPGSGIDLLAFADGALYAQLFDIPRLADNASEAAAFRAVYDDPRYTSTLRFTMRR